MHAKRQDVYIANPALLKGKPKETIGNYVREELERNPFRKFKLMVPDIYGSFAAAKEAGGAFVRSEMAREYSGPSGLLESVEMRRIKSEADVVDTIMRGTAGKYRNANAYCKYMKVPWDDFKSEVSASYWELIWGKNHTVVADSAVEGRYHIFTRAGNAKHYMCVDNGKISHEYGGADLEIAMRLIDAYEYVRNLGNFDPQHCPIIELQTGEDGAVWFLQYHRTRDFKPASFALERQPDENETVARWVRGATDFEKQEFKVLLFYGDLERMFNAPCPEGENWMHSGRNLPIYYESLMAGRRRLQLIPADMSFVCTHTEISRLIKPEITALIGGPKLLKENEYKDLWHQAYITKQDQFITLQVSSDGRKMYTNRVG